MKRVRKLTAAMLALTNISLTLSLLLPYWDCGRILRECIEDGRAYREVMFAVATLLAIGLALLFAVFIIEVVLLCAKAIPTGTVTVRFVFIYVGSLSSFCGVLLYTGLVIGRWAYFLAIFGATIAFVVQKLAMISWRCVIAADS
ncbi:expressed conserved protein [Echinococcus multilocularis]|uniref:Expressed conserved protein n=1 Tax=Echinococcus multilocularis TaxID=6211 RepID=A0A087VXA5_ECHMU|nr:expressed conserved protein [Echinococcus multilocularis]